MKKEIREFSKNSFDYRFFKPINLFNVDKKFMVPFF